MGSAGVTFLLEGIEDPVNRSQSALSVPSTLGGAFKMFITAPLVAKIMAGVTLGVYILQLVFPSLEDYFAIIATNTYGAHAYLWNIFTAGFFNNNLAMTIAVALSLLVMGRYLVTAWGSKEFLQYVIFVNSAVGAGIFVAQIFYYMTSFQYQYLEVPVSGGMGILSALVVTIKQRLGDEPIIVGGTPVGGLRAKDVPGILICLSAVLSLLNLLQVFTHCLCGIYFGWVYLRFLQRHEDGLRGDLGGHMAFETFFPTAFRPLAKTLGCWVYSAVCGRTMQTMLDDLPLASAELGAAMQGGVSSMVDNITEVAAPPLPGSNVADAERRRARALEMLESRLRAIELDPTSLEKISSEIEEPTVVNPTPAVVKAGGTAHHCGT